MTRILGRKKSNRLGLMRNLLTSLIIYESIVTTKAKAKELVPVGERLFFRSKKNDLNAKRQANKILYDQNAVSKLFAEIVPRYDKKNSGFIRVYSIDNRKGDNAPMALVELVDKKVFVKKNETSKSKTKDNDKKEPSVKKPTKSLKNI